MTASRKVVTAFIGCAMFVSAARVQAQEQSRREPAQAELEERFGHGLEDILKKFSLPGVTAAYALPDGKVVAFAKGLADKESGTHMTIDTRMPAGSIGKTFVAAAVVGLAQDGKLSLDDKLEKWLGEETWFADLPNGHDLTLRHLLMHRGGLADHVNDLRFALRIRKAVKEGDEDFQLRPAELVGFILKRKPLFAADEKYAYTDTGYILLGMVIERAGRASYYDQLRKRFLEPLKLTHTEAADRRDLANIAAGYLAPTNPLGLPEKTTADGKLRFNPANEWTGGGLVSNPQDLVRWAKELYEGRALAKPYVEELVNPGPPDQKNPSVYGLGVFAVRNELGLQLGHSGWFPGYSSTVNYYPDAGIAVAFQTNTDETGDLLADLRTLVKDVLQTAGRSAKPPAK